MAAGVKSKFTGTGAAPPVSPNTALVAPMQLGPP